MGSLDGIGLFIYQGIVDHGGDGTVDSALVSQFAFAFGGVDVEVHEGGVCIYEEMEIGEGPAGKGCRVGVGYGLDELIAVDDPVVDQDADLGPVASVAAWIGAHGPEAFVLALVAHLKDLCRDE